MMRPNIEVMCIVKFQYATSAMLALPYDHFLVSLLFLYRCANHCYSAIPTFNFIFECFYLTLPIEMSQIEDKPTYAVKVTILK